MGRHSASDTDTTATGRADYVSRHASTDTETAQPEKPFLKHTCNGGRPPAYGRLKPEICARCAERAQERAAGIPAREAPAAIRSGQRRRENEERWLREWNDHIATWNHRNNQCNGGLPCTFGQW